MTMKAATARFRRCLSFLVYVLLPLSLLGQGQFTCERTGTPVNVRSEGLAELLSDVVLTCTGGTPVARGATLPAFQIVVTANASLTSRVLVPGTTGTGLSEVLLVVDEPSFIDQVGCLASAAGDACPSGQASQGAPNVFQGRQMQANSITFRSVPLNPPGTQGTRTLRITNLRADVAALSLHTPTPSSVSLAVQIFDQNGSAVPIRSSESSSGDIRTGSLFAVRTIADTAPALRGMPPITIPPASLPVGAPQLLTGFNLKFTEGFAGAFRRRNAGTSSESPFFMTVQATPGMPYSTESGFLNTLFPNQMKMDSAGLADTGTRLLARFENVPKDVLIWVSTRDVRAGTTQFSETQPRAILTSADTNGGGPLTPVKPSINGLAQIPVVNGFATAVWEVISASPVRLQDISFGAAISAQTANPGQGTVQVRAGLAPLAVKEGTNDALPLFANTATPVPAFAVSNLLTVPAINTVSAASYAAPVAAPGSIVASFGSNLAAASTFASDTPLPDALAGTSVELIDSTGTKAVAPLFFVSPSQINYVVSPEMQPGPILVNVLSNTRLVASGYLQLDSVAPSLFSANGDGCGVAAGEALTSSGGPSVSSPLVVWDTSRTAWIARPVSLSAPNEFVFLTLYGTGIRGRTRITDVRATAGGLPVPVTYAGTQGIYPGLDQVNIGPLPRSLAGRGVVDVVVSVGANTSNAVQLYIQ
jgi:uncharacterized protein (TIGR03437 family)